MDASQIVLAHLPGGVNTALDPSVLLPSQVSKAINARIEKQLITTRPGARFLANEGDEGWRSLNIQGALYYDPAKGQGAQVFADESASFIVAAGGKKYRLFVHEKSVTSREISDGFEQDPKAHLIWMCQAENFLIAGDGKGSTFIYDGETAAFSSGFNGIDRENSSIPQGIKAPVYAYGRLWVVVDSRKILASDSLHGENLTSSADLLKFTEQTYWATGQYFVPPSAMGNIIAGALLPTRDTRTGQGEIMWHCVNGGVFSIDGNIFPREAWSHTPMVRHFLLDTASSGPYAIDLQEGDQLFRSRAGIQTLRSAAAESRLIGRPHKPISEEVDLWMRADYVPYLRFCSLVNHSQGERLLVTTAPTVNGMHRYHKGLLSLNWDVMDSGQSQAGWEGLWTFPQSFRYITQLLRGMFADRERVFGLHFDGEKNCLVEYDEALTSDVLEDGTRKPIQTIVETREINSGTIFDELDVVSGTLHLRDVKETTKWEVFLRNHKDQCWTKWRDGEVCVEQCPDDCSLVAQQPRHVSVELGKPPDSILPGRRFQFRIVFTGWARIEGLVVRVAKISTDDTFREERLSVPCKDFKVCCPDDFAYSQ